MGADDVVPIPLPVEREEVVGVEVEESLVDGAGRPVVEFVRREEEVTVRGPVEVGLGRPIEGGPVAAEADLVAGFVDGAGVGLSHEEKKSSVDAEGVLF